MLCSGDREKGEAPLEERWDYVNLDDFKAESCWSIFSYCWLWAFLWVSLAVYGVDSFTAVNLLAFSRWAGRIKPAIPFYISRWIFAACILASFVLLVYRWVHALRAIRSGSIARSYLDDLAVRIQSARVVGKNGHGWKKFLVFAELTKSKKGAEYVALYSYFSFEIWMNTVFADGPRQVVNAITLYSVAKSDLLPGGKHTEHDSGNASTVSQFFTNLQILAQDNTLQVVVLLGMLFTVVIWVISILRLASAVVLYLIFLFHHIPAEDGSLKAYCRRKIGTRLRRIVRRKVDKALAEGVMLQERTPTATSLITTDSKPTLPMLEADKVPSVVTLSRSTTQTTLPPYTRSNSTAPEQNPTLPNLEFDSKPPLTRTTTQSSLYSESSSLTENSAVMGYSPLDRQNSPAPPVPPIPSPFVNDLGRSSPSAGSRNLTDHGPGAPYRSFSPAVDSYGRSNTPGVVLADPSGRAYTPSRNGPYAPPGVADGREDANWARTGTPFSQRGTPHPQQTAYAAYSPQDGYPVRSFTPASTGGTPAPPTGWSTTPPRSFTPATPGETPAPLVGRSMTPARSYTPANTGTPAPPTGRTMTPTSYRATPPPTSGPSRSFTPVAPSSNPAPQSGGYSRFNPPITSQTPQPRPAPAGYQPFTRANTASPSAMYRNGGPPAGHSFNHSNTNQF